MPAPISKPRLLSLLLTSATCTPLASASKNTDPPASQPTTSAPTTQPILIPAPLHRLRLPGNPDIHSAAFSPDGLTLYVHVNGRAINIWELLLYFWPELLGGLTALIALICLIPICRIARRPRIPGLPHCRRCNYCLHGVSADRCPECGRPTKLPILGRTTRRRILPFATVLSLTILAYSALWIARFPRSGPASAWFNWWSYDLEAFAKDRGLDASAAAKSVDRILELDTLSGQIRRTLFSQATVRNARCPLVCTPDGLVVTIEQSDCLGVINCRTGQIGRTLDVATPLDPQRSKWAQVSVLNDAADLLLVVLHDFGARKTRVLSWRLPTGEATELFETNVDSTHQAGIPSDWPRRFYRVPGTPPRFLELPSSMVMHIPDTAILRNGANLNQIIERFKIRVDGVACPLVAPDGSHVLMSTYEGHNLMSYTLGPPPSAAALESRDFTFGPRGTLSGSVGRAFISARRITYRSLGRSEFGIAVLDPASDTVIAFCIDPPEFFSRTPYASPDGRFLAVDGFLRNPLDASGRYQHELLIYDLRSLPPP